MSIDTRGVIMPRDYPCAVAPQSDPLRAVVSCSGVLIRSTRKALVRIRNLVPSMLPEGAVRRTAPFSRRTLPAQTRSGPTPISGAISYTRHQARASSSVRPWKSCSSGEWSISTELAWSTV